MLLVGALAGLVVWVAAALTIEVVLAAHLVMLLEV